MLFHERILNFPPCLVPSDDYLNGSKHINFLFPHTLSNGVVQLILVVSSWTHPTPYPSSRYWKSNKKKLKMGPKFDPTAITIGKIILTKKSLVIYPPPPSETYQQAWSGKFCWLRIASVLSTIELCVLNLTNLSLKVHWRWYVLELKISFKLMTCPLWY